MATYRPPFARRRQLLAAARADGAKAPNTPAPAVEEEVVEEQPRSVPVQTPVAEAPVADFVLTVFSVVDAPVVVVEEAPASTPTDAIVEEVPAPAPDVAVVASDEAEEAEDTSEEDWSSFSRKELNALAVESGIEHPDKLPNKAAVIAAIEEAAAKVG